MATTKLSVSSLLLSWATLLLAGFVHFSGAATIWESEMVPVYKSIEVNGNLSLPDPESLNAYLRENTGLLNPLLANHPPLQLQKCSFKYYNNTIDFYTFLHPANCSTAPGWALDSRQARRVYTYKKLLWTWNVAFAGLLILCYIALRLSGRRFEEVAAGWFPNLNSPQTSLLEALYGTLWFLLSAISWIPSIPVYATYFVSQKRYLPQLPDPSLLIGPADNLQLCTVRDVFQVYLGFADSCHRVQWWIYSEAWAPETEPLVQSFGLTFFIVFANMLTWVTWTFLAGGVLYWCFFEGPRLIKKLYQRRRVCNVEMQAPAGSAV